jgi:hypothetical protein
LGGGVGDVEEVQHRLNTIVAELLYDFDTTPLDDRWLVYCKHSTALSAWDERLKNLLAHLDLTDARVDGILRAACLLKVFRNLVFLILQFFQAKDELFKEILTLTAIVDKGEMVYGKKTDVLDFSSDLGIIAPLFFTAMTYKNMVIRKRAWKALCKARRR